MSEAAQLDSIAVLGAAPRRRMQSPRIEEVGQIFVLTMAAYNLTRMRTLGKIRPREGREMRLKISKTSPKRADV